MVKLRKRKAGKNVIRTKSKASWFKPKTKHASARTRRVSAQKRKNTFVSVFVFLFIAIILIGILGFLVLIAFSLKSGSSVPVLEQTKQWALSTPLKVFFFDDESKVSSTEKFVVGLDSIPTYPNSEFIFNDYISLSEDGEIEIPPELLSESDGQALYKFFASGQSVYRLPLNTTWEDVQTYYKEELEKEGWVFTMSVPVTDLDRIPGEYYVKDGVGLHLYEISYDIWYETITEDQASDGLRDKIVAYKAKQELVAAASGRAMPEESGWKMKYSRDWDIEMQDHPTLDVKNIHFTHFKSKEKISFIAISEYENNIADLQYTDLEKIGIEYISIWLATQPAEVKIDHFKQSQLTVAGSKSVYFYNPDIDSHFLVVFHSEKKIFYIIQYIGTEEADFIEYIKDNLKVIK